ncbi:MAG TPA: tetratricopeptide repeat protein [Noviherbaspirillum sp.]|uniref:tetratricopeptide repeat protein n=1 Tax=Noviherbaspirillum sp. TaxID=1926288 RepID=UPI002D6620E9|nr:tetratricopeptide repeat protein [Noviherbaspirillum sp.]HYD93821.1 tetratricopeptide repeat protein [Noviherbaspirillum sp.]
MTGLTIADVEEKYGVRRRVVSELVKAGFVRPQRGARREYRFAFRDVVLMRMAQDLFQSGIPPKKTARFLQQLQRELPAAAFAAARVAAVGKELAVRDGGRLRSASGQLLIDFTDAGGGASLSPFTRGRGAPATAQDWYRQAQHLEARDPVGAARCYREAITIDPAFENAYVNLGHLLLANGQALEACIALQEGVAHCGASSLIHFNLAIAQEDLRRAREAMASYERALECDPGFADAHFNLARLHQECGHLAGALRHLNAYRKLTQGD